MKNGNFLFGMGLGSVIGILVYKGMKTPESKILRHKARHAIKEFGNNAGNFFETAKEKAMHAGSKIAYKVADMASSVADKVDDVKDKAHTVADNIGV